LASDLSTRVESARTDPLFAWRVIHPELNITTIQIVLDPEAAQQDAGRRAFTQACSELLQRHEPRWDRLVLSGIPAIRARYIDAVEADIIRIWPTAFVLIACILVAVYRSKRIVGAALLTVFASVVWTVGFMGMWGLPIGVLTSLTPILVMIISVSDTVHIVNDVNHHSRAATDWNEALVAGLVSAAGPCLLTEIAIACGFLSLTLVNIVAINEFGWVSAVGMILAWLANVTVLPLLLAGADHVEMGRADRERSRVMIGGIGRFIAWAEHQVTMRPQVVVACCLVLVGAAATVAVRLETVHYVFDDLRPNSTLAQELRYAELVHGGLVPVAVFLEATDRLVRDSPTPVLEPAALEFLQRAETRLRAIPEVQAVSSLPMYLRKAHAVLLGEERAALDGGLPATRQLASQETELLDDGTIFRDVLSFDRSAAAVMALVPDMPSHRVAEVLDQLQASLSDTVPSGYRAHVTGVLSIADRVTEMLVDGLLRSFAVAVLVTAGIFCFVLRSVRLAIIGLVPNLIPIVFMMALMAALDIALKPSTVILFSMLLTIADDDTIQYLSRFRRRFMRITANGGANPHKEAALSVLRESAPPMLVTATAVSAGMLILLLSTFQGLANLGLLTAVTLFVAAFADIFLTPILIMKWRPAIGRSYRYKQEDTE